MTPARLFSLLLVLVYLLCIYPSFVCAQITNIRQDTTTPIPGVGHGYIGTLSETVNPADGSVSLHLDLPVPPSRGITLPFSINYNSNGATHLATSTDTIYECYYHDGSGCDPVPSNQKVYYMGFQDNIGPFESGGWSYTVPLFSLVQTTTNPTNNNPGTVGSTPCYYNSNFLFRDPSGGRHSFGLGTVNPTNTCTRTWITSAHEGDYYATLPAGPMVPQIVSASGITYKFNCCGCQTSGFCTGGATSAEDSNGNIVSFAYPGSGFSMKDTSSRTSISFSTFASSADQITTSGFSNPFIANWQSVSTATTSPINSYLLTNAGSCIFHNALPSSHTVIQSLTLPNGQSYQFSYDATYGLLTKVVYPSGGYIQYVWGLNQNSSLASWTASGCQYTYDTPAMLHRYVSFDGSTVALELLNNMEHSNSRKAVAF